MQRFLTLASAGAIVTLGMLAFRSGWFRAAERTRQIRPGPVAALPDTIGKPLYPATAVPPRPIAPPTGVDPMIISDCRLSVCDKVEVSCEREGIIRLIGTEVGPGESVAAERTITIQWGNQARLFRRLREGDAVTAGQLLGILDDHLSRDDLAIKNARLAAARADHLAAVKTSEESRHRYEILMRLRQQSPGATAEEEVRAAKLVADRSAFDAISKRESVILAERELSQAETILRMHEIRSAQNGVIKTIHKKMGEAVKALEPVFQIQDPTRLRVEGQVEIHQLPRLRLGLIAELEPVRPEGPQLTLVGHHQEVTALAVCQDLKCPLIVSASMDGTVRVWDLNQRRERSVFQHRAAVHAVACARAGDAANGCLTGAADGIARLWDLQQPARPPRLFDGRHSGAITSVAISPDGKTCATGGEDHSICLWNAETAQARYHLPPGHRGAITSLCFTAQCQLVSAGRDNTLRVWSLGEFGARLDGTIANRSGEVAHLGVRPDGKQAFFDDGSVLRLLSLPDGQTEYVLENSDTPATFSRFAHFSSDQRFLLTSSDHRTQLWRAPTAQRRAGEVKQLIVPGTATCAAFAPDASYIAVGTAEHQVMMWTTPAPAELDRTVRGRLTLVEYAEGAGRRHARVWAEVANPDGALLPGSTVTMTVYP